MENLNLISMSAVRSAMKVIYTPAITLARPIGLRNDPHTATILHMGSQFRTDFEGAVAQMTPFERRDFEQWQQSEEERHFGSGVIAHYLWPQLCRSSKRRSSKTKQKTPRLIQLCNEWWTLTGPLKPTASGS